MLFNSFEFVFGFLPITLFFYFLLNRFSFLSKWDLSKIWLFACSIFFYGWWNPKYLILIISSIIINYVIGTKIGKDHNTLKIKKILLTSGLLFNLGLLGYFKYANFFIDNTNYLFNSEFYLSNIILPLGISFFLLFSR